MTTPAPKLAPVTSPMKGDLPAELRLIRPPLRESVEASCEIIRTQHEVILDCYATGRERGPALESSIELSFRITRAGRVKRLEAHAEDFTQPEVARCLAKHARSWRYPASAGETEALSAPVRVVLR